MMKADLIDRLQKKNVALTKKQLHSIFDQIFGEMNAALWRKGDGHFVVPGFGSFTRKLRKARVGRNPRTGEEVAIPERFTITFKPYTMRPKR